MSIVRSDDLAGPAVFGCAQAGCRVCQGHLVRQHEGLVHFVLRRQVHGDVAYAELLQAGRIGLWQAVLHFDAKRGVAFSTYAVVAIQRRMWQAVVQAQPPRQHRVFVHALRQRRRPYPLPLTDTRQRLRHHLLRLLQPIQKRAEVVAGMTPTRLTLPVLNRTVFAQMPICHDRMYRRIRDGKVRTTRIRAAASAAVPLFRPPSAPLHLRPPARGWQRQDVQTLAHRQRLPSSSTRRTQLRRARPRRGAGGAFAAGKHWSAASA